MAEATVSMGRNRLLESLDSATRKSLTPHLTLVDLHLKQYIYKPNEPLANVYFPINAVISMLAPPEVGASIEVATIGNEGFAGLPVFLGAKSAPGTSFAQIAGQALRMRAVDFRSAVERNGSLTRVLHRYTQALMVQISQGTACNRAHSIQQRCARWLLLTHDRVGGDEFPLTQEFLAQMLGVRRASVGEVATALQKRGLIRYSRGRIRIMNRRGLESASCICYSIIRNEYERLLKT
jgi:CRP-like cAMP-binding protein